MPFATEPRERVHGTWPMCRVVVATRRLAPRARVRGLPRAAVRAVHDARGFLEDRTRSCTTRSPGCPASTPTRSSPPRSDPETEALFEAGPRRGPHAPPAAPTEFQNKHANTDGRVRYTAPEHQVHERQGATLEAGGFQSFEAYDVLIANLDRSLTRRAPATDAAEVLTAFPDGLTTGRGRADHGRGQVRAGPRRGRGLPDRRDRVPAPRSACRSGTTRCGSRARPSRSRRPLRQRTTTGAGRQPRRPAPQSIPNYGVVVESVKVSVLLYAPVRSASLDLIGCLKPTVSRVVGHRTVPDQQRGRGGGTADRRVRAGGGEPARLQALGQRERAVDQVTRGGGARRVGDAERRVTRGRDDVRRRGGEVVLLRGPGVNGPNEAA